MVNHLRFSNQKACYHIVKNTTDFSLKLKDKYFCYNEPSLKLNEENLRICLPLVLFLAWFRLGHYNEMGGQMGATKTHANAERFYYWPGMFDWNCALTADCITCQNNKPKPNIETKLILRNGKMIPYLSVRCLLIIKDHSIRQANAIFIAS